MCSLVPVHSKLLKWERFILNVAKASTWMDSGPGEIKTKLAKVSSSLTNVSDKVLDEVVC